MQILFVLYIFGFGIVTLPRTLALSAGNHAWVSILLATAAACVIAAVIAFTAHKSGKRRFPEFANAVLGLPLGKVVCFLFAARLLLLAATRLNVFGGTMTEFMLPYTPQWLILLVFVLICIYAAVKKFETQARLAEVLIFFMAIPIVYVIAMSLRSADFGNLLPLHNINTHNVTRSSFDAFFAFSGIELLFIAIPYVCLKNGANITKRSVLITAVIGAAIAIGFASVIVVFGETTTANNNWQFLRMMDAVRFPGQFFTRQGALIMCFWIVSAFAAISAEIFFASLLLKDVVNLGKRRWYVLAAAAVVFALVIAQTKSNIFSNHLQQINTYAAVAFMLVLPFVMLLIYPFRRRKINETIKNSNI